MPTVVRLAREGVLVVGPNPVFLRYISQVLPSLGETSATQTTVEANGLSFGALTCGTEGPLAAGRTHWGELGASRKC